MVYYTNTELYSGRTGTDSNKMLSWAAKLSWLRYDWPGCVWVCTHLINYSAMLWLSKFYIYKDISMVAFIVKIVAAFASRSKQVSFYFLPDLRRVSPCDFSRDREDSTGSQGDATEEIMDCLVKSVTQNPTDGPFSTRPRRRSKDQRKSCKYIQICSQHPTIMC